ncbi:MAG: HAMP domain-containing sensor histidine kinase [Sporolactobacillus sp.]
MKKVARFLFWLGSVLLFFSLISSFFYALLNGVRRLLHAAWPSFVVHLLSANLGVVGFISVFYLTAHVYAHRHHTHRANYFQALMQAIREISKGNFDIDTLDLPVAFSERSRRHNPFQMLSDGLKEMAHELGKIDQVRQQFISNVSHEIQSPLTSIKGFARALENAGLSEQQRLHYLQIIQQETERLSNLSTNLLKLTSLENDVHLLAVSAYRVDRQIRQSLLFFETKWEEKQLTLDIELEPVVIRADAELMEQVWRNLIQNSIKFTPAGGRIAVKLYVRKHRAYFEISDTGIGIRPEEQVHLFERFYKADRSRNRMIEGSGLGLSIVKKIIDVHGWSIRVASDYGHGTTFIVSVGLPDDETHQTTEVSESTR